MKSDLTDLTVVLDRSGSMSACQKDAEDGLNAFIANQKGLPGECTFSLVQFDTEYEFVYKWQFTFLGANQDAFAEAGALGFAPDAIGNYKEVKTAGMFLAATSNVGRMRHAAASGQSVQNKYTPEERKAMQ